MPNLLEIILGEFREKRLPSLVERDISVPMIPGKIKEAVGMRRSGKTCFLYQQIARLQKEKIPAERIFYINFEDERLLPMDAARLGKLLDEFYTFYPRGHQETCYFFLDEIQNVEEWPVVLRRFLDTRKVEIFVTGSSAKLLSKEIATNLRGRSFSVEVWPFSFREYLKARDIPWPAQKPLGPALRDTLQFELKHYLKRGGFPESIHLKEEEGRMVLQDYVNLVVYRDIIERYHATNHILLKYLVKTLLKSAGSLFSANKFYNDIKSQGIRAGKNTVYEYLEYVEDAYLAFTVPLFSESVRKRSVNPRKVYAIDAGLVRANTLMLNENAGALFENLVWLDLRRKGYQLSWYKTSEGYEVDLIAQDPKGGLKAFQVCYDIQKAETLEREERALKAVEKELKIEGHLITPQDYPAFLMSI